MTITANPSAPLIAVVGATGAQGGSVVCALSESDKEYRIRAFTRDAAKPVAKALQEKGVAVVQVSLTADNKDAVFKAFEGIDYAFIVTNWAEHGDPAREATEGMLMIDAAKAGGARGIIWSGLSSIAAISGGKYAHVGHFESKARVSTYGRASGVPFVDIQAGGYAQQLLGQMRPRKIVFSPDTWALSLPMAPTALMPGLDIADYGLWVRKALESPAFPDGETWAAWGDNGPMGESMKILAEHTGKNVIYNQIPPEVFAGGMKAMGVPPHIVTATKEVFCAMDEFSYFGKDVIWSQEGLGRKPKTLKEFIEASDWSKILV